MTQRSWLKEAKKAWMTALKYGWELEHIQTVYPSLFVGWPNPCLKLRKQVACHPSYTYSLRKIMPLYRLQYELFVALKNIHRLEVALQNVKEWQRALVKKEMPAWNKNLNIAVPLPCFNIPRAFMRITSESPHSRRFITLALKFNIIYHAVKEQVARCSLQHA